ncbi:DUF2019 domain-containing protein [Aquiflexum sp. TKW24L]|uniref:DUF2019 domain-containing protein n=1 Tax=Aquiflexum sp. TKW24L TaxID=2942212 RepID=UPI0020C0172F|nr:DUF2019 domain-containing protein [Aquiflexum sp. TKW24L]MCL6259980.1 DUF2019 domain-containing protein [Aquiflexum sp. TKW24L]
MALTKGDFKKANKLHKKIQALYIKARECNQVDLFSELLGESDENVRLWAATFSLKVFPDTAEKALKNLSNSTSITGLSTKTTLDLWKQGNLNLL